SSDLTAPNIRRYSNSLPGVSSPICSTIARKRACCSFAIVSAPSASHICSNPTRLYARNVAPASFRTAGSACSKAGRCGKMRAMTTAQASPSSAGHNTAEVRRVLWRVLVLNAIVAAAKLVIGIMTGAVAMIADGFHSSMDASSNVLGLVGIKLAAQPPDEEHPYGHRRFETLATLGIGGLLLVAAWE